MAKDSSNKGSSPKDAPKEAESEEEEPSKEKEGSAKDLGTVTGVIVFLTGALTTVLTAISDFGADDAALSAARRNHATMLVVAVGLAVGGMFFAASYGILNTWKHLPRLRGLMLWAGAGLVLAAVGLGIAATTNRDPADVAVSLTRKGPDQVDIVISGEGFPSDKRFEAIVTGHNDPFGEGPSESVEPLARGRVSPLQSGAVNWTLSVDVSTPPGVPPITNILVHVHDAERPAGDCNLKAQGVELPTCVYMRLPPVPASATDTTTTTPSTTSPTTTGATTTER